jgi:hypothetical protein
MRRKEPQLDPLNDVGFSFITHNLLGYVARAEAARDYMLGKTDGSPKPKQPSKAKSVQARANQRGLRVVK